MAVEEKMSFAKRCIACACALAFALSLVPAAAFATPVHASESDGITAQAVYDGKLDVTYRSETEIRNYYKNNNIDLTAATQMELTPVTSSPYALGMASQKSLGQTLTTLNFIRFVAGLDDSVSLDPEYGRLAQSAALVNAANGQLTHAPTQPDGMPHEMFQDGVVGAANSNIYATTRVGSLQDALVNGWLYDSDANNIQQLGHRRWILNPAFGKTGFGIVPDSGGKGGYRGWAAMYANDQSNTRATQTSVAWPAQVTPVELFDSTAAWSLSTGDLLDESTVKVTLTRTNDSKVWNFSKDSADGDFYVDNNRHGQQGCVIFRPNDIQIDPADYYTVSITGIPNPVSYNVNFFGLQDANTITSVSVPATRYDYTGSEIKPKVTAKYYNRVLTQDKDYEVTYTNNVEVGTATVTVRGIGDYNGSPVKSTTFEIVPAGSEPTPVPSDPQGSPVVMYRLYNPNSGEHFYTADEYERATLIGLGWDNEDVGWVAPSEGDEVYRLYNAVGGEHHYTLSPNERNTLVALGWTYEGVGWHSGGRTPLYREYNPNAYANNHNYTTDTNEHSTLVGLGWADEGIGWYGIE